jgi:cytochrome oxidase Cu insertion factor (SCO1/SenC/PrrC family)
MVYQSSITQLLACLLSVSLISPAFAQQGAGRTQLPELGTMLPVVKAFDDQGNEFSTASLRGSYTVLVFGCLT